ncbi:MAG: beta-galactosidase, partial [Chloroflexi bacterium]|nr:beta-galactosidase [Chloroflexota bacterium]
MKNKSTLLLIFHLLILLVSLASLFFLLRDYQDKTRGVSTQPISPLVSPFGVNASLEKYANDADLNRALELIRGAGFVWVRQFFYWNDIEPRAGEYEWEKWDRLVARADAYGLKIVAVIMTTPEWARDAGERDLVNAKPAREEDFARFVRAFVMRYREKIQSVQIWDNPNVHPFWGRRNADPFEYVAMLRAGALAARAVNPNVKIISAGLADSDELIRAHPDYSDILYLRGMYDAGARPFFDILGAKTYGMWSGPDDRRAAMDTFNFSRAILLREEMIAHSDADKPMWAVEMGWNALPRDYRGAPSPWGNDTEAKQSARLAQAIARARSEWGWMPALFVQHFQPNARDDDPVWGFALVDKNFQPRALYDAAKNAIAAPIQTFSFDYARFYFLFVSLVAMFIFSASRAWRAFDSLAWRDAWRAFNARFNALPNFSQYAILVTSSAAFYFSPNAILNFALLAFLVLLFSFRLDLALALTVFSIPFYLLPKNLIGGAMFSIVELLTLACVGAWGIQKAASKKQKAESGWLFAIRHPQTAIRSLQLETCDYA